VNSEKKSEGNYKNGKREGGWKVYSSKGNLIAAGSYSNGNRVGMWQFYDSEGNKTSEKDYSAPPATKTPSKSGNKTTPPLKKTK
jgi:antitoxin component YwqK of YwqJK toxin-antitoxin module